MIPASARTVALALALFASGCSSCNDKSKATVDAAPAASVDAAPVLAFPKFEPPFAADAGAGWSGSLRYGIKSAAQKQELEFVLFVRGDRVRYTSPNPYRGVEANTIVDVVARRLVTFSTELKEFVVIDLPAMPGDAGGFALSPTGKKQTIQGFECDLYEQKHGKGSSSACIYEGISYVDPSMTSSGVTPPSWVRALAVTKRCLLRAVEIDDTGKEIFHLELKQAAANASGLPVNLPSDYTQAKGRLPGSPFRPGLPD